MRETLLHQIGNAAAEIEAQLAELRRGSGTHDTSGILEQGRVRLIHLNVLRDQLVGGAKDVAALRADIASAVADIRAYTSNARSVTETVEGQSATARSLYQATEAAHRNVGAFADDYYKRRLFDPYLRFVSAEDEEAYRRREEERREAIEKAQTENTPQSNLRALDLSIAQMEDAGHHGADKSPAYEPQLDKLRDSRRALAAQLSAAEGRETCPPAEPTRPNPVVPDDVIASLRAANMALASESREGHGITVSAAIAGPRQRG